MEPENNAIEVNVPSEGNKLADDLYLTEMTNRIQRLRALIAEKSPEIAPQKRRRKTTATHG